MSDAIVIDKGRTKVITISLGYDVSGDTITSKIKTRSGIEIAEWDVVFDGDGTDGELILTLDDAVSAPIEHTEGLMDLKRVDSTGEPYSVFRDPVEVVFRTPIT